VDTNQFEKIGRVKVTLTVPLEPNFDKVINEHHKSQENYMNSYQAAAQVGISDNVFNRITGSVLIIAGMKRQVAENQSKHNIGLQMKFVKTNEELTGYTKRNRMWLYSSKTIEIVREYVAKFPQIFSVMEAKSGRNNNDVYFESDFFPETEDKEADDLQTLTKWLKELPSQKAERRQIGTQAVDKDVHQNIIREIKKIKDMPMKRISMQVKPHLLYAPSLAKATQKSPDYQASFELFDRVVIAREMEQFQIGLKGTVVGISKVKDLNPVRQDCINKEDVYCDVLFDNEQKGRLVIENLINISYGMSLSDGGADRVHNVKEEVKPQPPKLTESFSNILQKPQKVQNGQKFKKETQNVQKVQKEPQNVQNEPPKNDEKSYNNFLDMWNALKSGGPQNLPEAPVNNEMKKTNDALNKKMAEVSIGRKKNSPVPNDQSVPIMIRYYF
jgi:5'-3' exoribonuclease 1